MKFYKTLNLENFWKVFSYSLKRLIKSIEFWLYIGIFLFVNILLWVIVPLTSPTPSLEVGQSIDPTTAFLSIITSLMGILPMACYLSAFVAETNSDKRMLIFFLSRSVSKKTYYWSKAFSSLILTLLMCCIVIAGIYTANAIAIEQNKGTLFVKGIEIWKIIIGLISFCIFGTMLGNLLSNFLPRKIGPVIILVLSTIYSIVLPMIWMTSISEQMDWWIMSDLYLWILPLSIFLSLGLISSIIGNKLVQKKDIGV